MAVQDPVGPGFQRLGDLGWLRGLGRAGSKSEENEDESEQVDFSHDLSLVVDGTGVNRKPDAIV